MRPGFGERFAAMAFARLVERFLSLRELLLKTLVLRHPARLGIVRAFDDDVVHDEAPTAAILERKAAFRQIPFLQLERRAVHRAIDEMLQRELVRRCARDADAVVAAGLVARLANAAAALRVRARIVHMHARRAAGIAVDENVPAVRVAVVVEITRRDDVADAFGGTPFAIHLRRDEIERNLNPLSHRRPAATGTRPSCSANDRPIRHLR
jgi:hypothetical protein